MYCIFSDYSNLSKDRLPQNSITESVKTLPTATFLRKLVPMSTVAKPLNKHFVLYPKGVGGKALMLVPMSKPPSAVISRFAEIPPCALDDSAQFNISLEYFQTSTRAGIKKKMIEVLKTVDKLKVNPEAIMIAVKTQSKPKL